MTGLLELSTTGLLELSVARQKYCQTKMLPDEKHDRTIGIKCCQTKSMTGLLELRTIKCCQTKSMTGLLELRTIKCCQTKNMTRFHNLIF
ncbi:hypothetical protein RclHR1_02470002 [Rhizophagus clarus]|uniref:Uncharacterized protein n=1 Tax=Rhizophagus clarus TaxID=94130 RepID=A0A2Z6RSM8_9GLOM|nr:hypothetical protein RclHR1_02470002 [Rhizophagus clarus]